MRQMTGESCSTLYEDSVRFNASDVLNDKRGLSWLEAETVSPHTSIEGYAHCVSSVCWRPGAGENKSRVLLYCTETARHATLEGQLHVKPSAMHCAGPCASLAVFQLIPISKTNAETNSVERSPCQEANRTLGNSRNSLPAGSLAYL